jgi:hypothetical protein
VGWQKGVVDQKQYYMDALRFYSLYLVALVLLLMSFVYAGVYELMYRRRVHGRGTIVAQYEPPQHLLPAEAEMLVKGYMRKFEPNAIVRDFWKDYRAFYDFIAQQRNLR